MNIELKQTTTSKVAGAVVAARRQMGSPTIGMVLTLVVVCDARHREAAIEAAMETSREHPSRVLVVVHSAARSSGLDASVRLGEDVPGELIELRLRGEVGEHPTSVVLPLLLPDSPVVVWWPADAPEDPGTDPIGRLGTRRITDSTTGRNPGQALQHRAQHLMHGDTDLTWTRTTTWRALLAAALDQYPARILSAAVAAPRNNASADLLAAWLESRLGVPVDRRPSSGPGITEVRMTTAAGDVAIDRPDGVLADYVVPGQPKRSVALRRRTITQLLSEELRRMDYDDVFEETLRVLVDRGDHPAATKTDRAGKTGKAGTSGKSTGKAGGKTTRKTTRTTSKKTGKAAGRTTAAGRGATRPADPLSEVAHNTPAPSAAQAEAAEAAAAVPISPLDAGLVTDES